MRRSSLTALVTTVVMLGLVGISSPVEANASGPNGRIAFARQIATGGADIFTANPDGGFAQQVPLPYPAEDFGIPIWSPDSSKLLIADLFLGETPPSFRPGIVDPDGSNFTLLLPPGVPAGQGMFCGSWNGDGTRLLCGLDNEGGNLASGVISIRSSDGGGLVRLTTNPYGDHDQPADISPDGKRFVFLRFKHENPRYPDQVALFVENIDGTGLRQITPYGVAEDHEIASAQWSPDGHEIISETGQGILFAVHPDGAGLTLIHLQVGTQRYFAFEPDWSPDGTRIVFCMFLNGQEDLYTADSDGSNVVQITNTPDFENGPNWGTHPIVS